MLKDKIDYSVNEKKYNSYSREIERLVPAKSKVLDIGCTTGKLAQALKAKGCTVTGIDIDDASLKKASKYCEKVIKIDVDDLELFNKKLKDEKFDVITLGDILEHLKYPGVLLSHLRKYLNPDGVIVSSIPNSAFIWMRVRFLLGNFTYSKNGGLMDEDHLRFFSFNTVKTLFKNSDFNVCDIYGVSVVKSKYVFLKYLAKIFPTLFAIHILIVAKPSRDK